MRLTNQFSVMGRKYDLAFGQANTWKRKLKNDKYELIENAIDKLGQYEDIDESPKHLAIVSKVLEIIKDKNVAMTVIKKTQSVIEYNAFAYDFLQIKRVDEEEYKLSPQPLAEEEYNLLKELLLLK